MADLLILGENLPHNAPKYRGTHRAVPYHCDGLPDEHEVNRAFFWYINEGGELGVVHSVSKARDVVRAYRQINPPERFDLIETVSGNGVPETGGGFLGIDLSCSSNYSLLSWGLSFSQPSDVANEGYQRIASLLVLIESYFRPKLNDNGLFDTAGDATLCLDCMMALQQGCPNLWEDEEMRFQSLSLYLVHVD